LASTARGGGGRLPLVVLLCSQNRSAACHPAGSGGGTYIRALHFSEWQSHAASGVGFAVDHFGGMRVRVVVVVYGPAAPLPGLPAPAGPSRAHRSFRMHAAELGGYRAGLRPGAWLAACHRNRRLLAGTGALDGAG